MAGERAWRLWVSAFGAAGAWTVAFLMVISAGSASCIGSAGRVARFGAAWWALAAVAGVCAAGGIYALVETLGEMRRASRSPAEHRAAFMSLGGALLNALFVIGFVYDALALLLAPVCG